MAEKIISGDSLQNEFVTKFNGMADEVNALKESSGGSGGAVVELSGESGKLTDEQYAQCILPNTTIKWLNGSGGNMIYEPWRFISPTYYFKSVYIDADECVNNTIEIDQISHGWKRKSTAYSGGSVPADAIIDVEKLPTEENAYLFQNGAKVEEYLMRKVVVHIVDTLPEVGEPLLTGSPSATMNVYYQKGDDEAYCYFTESVKPGYNYVGWSTLASGCAVLSITYGGIVTDESQATNSDTLYLVYNAGEYINKNAFYGKSVLEVYTLMGGKKNEVMGFSLSIEIVDTLPAVGKPYMDMDTMTVIFYYQKSDSLLYAYITTDMDMEMDMWMEISQMDMPYTVISSDEEAVSEEVLYLVRKQKRELYWYNNAWEPVIQDVSKLIPQTKDTFTMVHSGLDVQGQTVNMRSNSELANAYDMMLVKIVQNKDLISQMSIKIDSSTSIKMAPVSFELSTGGGFAIGVKAEWIGITEAVMIYGAVTSAVFNSQTKAQEFANATVTYTLYY